MAKKETTKKTKKTSTKKVTSKKVIEEVEVNPEVMEELKRVSGVKVDFVEEDPPLEVENGDPAVLAPVEEGKKEELTIEEAAMKATFKDTNNNKSSRLLDKSFGYSWNGMEIDFF